MDAYLSCSDGREVVVTIRGEVDLANSESLRQSLILLTHPSTGRIALDLSQVTFMDCGGLRALIALALHARSCGGGVHTAAASPEVARLFELADPFAARDLSLLPTASNRRRRRRGIRLRGPDRTPDAPGVADVPSLFMRPGAPAPQAGASVVADTAALPSDAATALRP